MKSAILVRTQRIAPLPDYEAREFAVDRSITGKAINYVTQEVSWESRFNRRVPFRISTQNGIARPRSGNLVELGKKYTDTEVAWLAVDEIPAERRVERFTDRVNIQRFLDDGQKFSKSMIKY